MSARENAMLATYDTPPLPTENPDTGEAFVSHELNVVRDSERLIFPPPTAPSQEYDEYDDDGNLDRTVYMTDEMLGHAMAVYARAEAEWRKTGGVVYVAGPVLIWATFKTAAGGTAEAFTTPGAPAWWFTRWTSIIPARHPR